MSSLLTVEGLTVHFQSRLGVVHAVDGVYFKIGRSETVGLVGEFGCGKSTVGKAIVGLLAATRGPFGLFDGVEFALTGTKCAPTGAACR